MSCGVLRVSGLGLQVVGYTQGRGRTGPFNNTGCSSWEIYHQKAHHNLDVSPAEIEHDGPDVLDIVIVHIVVLHVDVAPVLLHHPGQVLVELCPEQHHVAGGHHWLEIRLPTIGHLAKISTELTLDSVAMVPRVLPGFFVLGFFDGKWW